MAAEVEAKRTHPFKRRDFRLLFGGLAVSTAGDWLYGIALVVYVFERTHSAAWVAVASVIRLLPYIVIGPLVGTLVDRYDRRLVILASNLLRAALMFAIALLAMVDGPLVVILALVLVSASGGTIDGPAVGAMVPSICSEDELGKANAALGTVENVAMIVGPALGSILILLGSTELAFAINGVTFLVASWFTYALRVRAGGPEEDAQERPKLLKQFAEGVRAATASGGVLVVMLFLFLSGLYYGHELVLVVLVAENKLDVGSEGIGWLNSAVGIGGVAAAGVASRMAANKRGDLMLLAAVVIGAVPYAILSLTDSFAVALAVMAALGAAAIAMDVIATTLLQRTVARDLHGRILALVDSVTVVGILIGSLIAPIAAETVGLDTTLLLLGTVPLLILLTAPKLAAISSRASDQMAALAPVVELLRGSPLFEGVDLTALESIASTAARRTIRSGEAVVTEGEPASDIYIVASGRFEVIARGEGDEPRVVNELGRGDHFGEIGVLARIPRTATVIAREDSEVLEIPGSVLLDVVNREPTGSRTIMDAVFGRLSRTHPSLAATKQEELIDGA